MATRGGALYDVITDVCALANTNGGTLYIGLSGDAKDPVLGVPSPDKAVDQLQREIAKKITPPINCLVDTQETKGKAVIRVLVTKGDDPPYAVLGLDLSGFLGLQMGGYLLVWFAMAGLLALLLLFSRGEAGGSQPWSWLRLPSWSAIWPGLLIAAFLCVGSGLLGGQVWLTWLLIPVRLRLRYHWLSPACYPGLWRLGR